jgi:TolB-like protein
LPCAIVFLWIFCFLLCAVEGSDRQCHSSIFGDPIFHYYYVYHCIWQFGWD